MLNLKHDMHISDYLNIEYFYCKWMTFCGVGNYMYSRRAKNLPGGSILFWTPGLPEGVLSNRPCPCVRVSVRVSVRVCVRL